MIILCTDNPVAVTRIAHAMNPLRWSGLFHKWNIQLDNERQND